MSALSADLAQSLFDRLSAAQDSRTLGTRLGAVLSPRARLWGHWGATTGPAEAEMAALPLSQSMEAPRLEGEDLIWAGKQARVASGRWRLSGRLVQDGPLGAGSGTAVAARLMAELYLMDDLVAEGVVILDTSGLLLQAGTPVEDWARARAMRVVPKLPEPPQATAQNQWADAWADLLTQGMETGFTVMVSQYAEGCIVDWPGQRLVRSRTEAESFWTQLRSALPGAEFTLCHRLGRGEPLMPPRASLRWRLTGRHDGWGLFGAPTGAMVSVVGISQVEFGPEGIRREATVFDEAAVWAQIYAQTGAHDG